MLRKDVKMKDKDRPLEWWKGKSFRRWCAADTNDTRKINYTFRWFSIGQGLVISQYTSDKPVDGITLYRIQNSKVNSIKLIENEWYVVLDYGCV